MSDRVDPTALKGPVRTDDWPVQATDAIVKVVGTAHDKVTGPLTTAARAVAYGLLAGILGITALVVGTVFLGRLLNAYLPEAVFGEHHMWAAHLVLGLVFTAAGLVLFRKARHRPEPDAA